MAPNSDKFVAYYRVSTARQGRSGLGLDAQRQAVKTYLDGGDWQIIGEFTEIESGRKSGRPALEKALAAARLHRASLIVSKVDILLNRLFVVTLVPPAVLEPECDTIALCR